MRIVILSTIENCQWAGTEEVWYQFALHAISEGHEVLVALHKNVSKASQVNSLKEKGVQFSVRSPFKPIRLYLYKEKFLSAHIHDVKKFRPDVLLINSGSLLDVTNLPYLNSFVESVKCKKIFFCHFVADLLVPHNREAIVKQLEACDKIVFVSEHNKMLAKRQLAYDLEHSYIIPNASKFERTEPFNFKSESIVRFASVARLETLWKSQDLLIELLSSEKWRQRSWTLNLYGTGTDEKYIQDLITLYQLEDKVFLKGYETNVEHIWSENEMLLLPSKGEGMPLAVIEAMMCGRIVVCTDVGGNKEIIEDKLSGFVAESYTLGSFDRALENAWLQKSRWHEIGRMAFEQAKKLNLNDPAANLLALIIK